MTVFDAVSTVNIVASGVLLGYLSYRLSASNSDLLRQILVTPLLLMIGLMVMHTYGLLRGGYDIKDIETMAWRFLDFLTLVVIARLVGAIPK